MICLDWTDRRHWGGGSFLACRLCGGPALLRDDAGRPAHKTCVEAALEEMGGEE